MYGQGVKGHEFKEIPTAVSGKMSIPFCVALALVKGSAGMRDFSEENIHDPQILDLLQKTEVYPDAEMTAMVPQKRAANVEVILKDGTHFLKHVDFAKGEPEIPMTLADFKTKFTDLACYGGKTEEETEEIAKTVLEKNGKVRELIGLLK